MENLKDLLKSIKSIKNGKENKLVNRLELTEDIIRIYRDYLIKLSDKLPWGVIISHGYKTSKELEKDIKILSKIYEELNLYPCQRKSIGGNQEDARS